MGIQVRVVHALGDRLIEVPERPPQSPVVIGRDPQADVQVPEAAVSRRHALLWVQEGHWLIRDGKGGGNTLVNGRPAAAATVVRSGDVVALGTGAAAPTLQIDPFGLMTAAPQPAARVGAAGAGAPAPRPAATPRTPAYPAAMHDPQPALDGMISAAEPTNGDGAAGGEDDWLASAAVSPAVSSQRFYVPKRNAWTPGLVSLLVFSTLVLVGVAWYFYSVRQRANEDALRVEQARAQEQQQQVRSKNIFEATEAERLRQLAIKRAQEAATRTAVTSTGNAAAQDPGRQTLEWKKVEEAHSGFTPKEAVVVYNDYGKLHAQSPYAADVRRYTDEALDRLWWEHIAQLISDRDEVMKEIKQRNADIASTKDADTRKTLEEEKAPLEDRLAHIDGQLKAMNYASQAKPVVEDEQAMAELRRARNPVTYDPWKEATEKRIKESRGQRAISFPGDEGEEGR